ncbi:hypothetical protein MESS4_340174 [Mesorhizobium sp. STM 4661]|nr:hypothetical protein MESS4_340174 [Mesorhizobium sp. STM 4661]
MQYRLRLNFVVCVSGRLSLEDAIARRVKKRGTSRVGRSVQPRIPAARQGRRHGLPGA